jgi:hypothetical protein
MQLGLALSSITRWIRAHLGGPTLVTAVPSPSSSPWFRVETPLFIPHVFSNLWSAFTRQLFVRTLQASKYSISKNDFNVPTQIKF